MDRHRVALLVLALLLAPLTTLRLYGSDEIQYFAWLRSAVFDRDLDFENEYRWFWERDPGGYAGFAKTFLGPRTPAGRVPNNAPIGCAALWAPFYLGAIGAERALGLEAKPDGFSRLAISAVCLASMLYGVAGLFLADAVARRFATKRAAFAATLLVWLGTNLLFYLYVTPPMSHACSFFATALFLWAWIRDPGASHPLGLGLLAGLAASVRWQEGLWVVVPVAAPLFSGEVRGAAGLGRWVLRSAAIGVGALVAFAPQIAAWQAVNGSITPYGVIAAGDRFDPTAPYLAGVLFSSFHGLFTWSPVLVPALGGLLALAARDGRGAALALGVALQLWLLSGYVVAFGHGFGQRLFVGSLPAAAVGLAHFAARTRLPRLLLLAGGALCVWWNLSLMVQHATGMIPRDRGVDLRTLVENQLVHVPARLPAVVRRYLFERESFYEIDPLRDPRERE